MQLQDVSEEHVCITKLLCLFCKDWCSLCNPEDLWCDCMWRWTEQVFARLKESAASERPGRLPWPAGAPHQASWAANSSCAAATWAAPGEPSCGTPQKAAWRQQEPGTAVPLGGAKLPWCSCLLQEEPPEGLCCQLCLVKVVCGHVGGLELLAKFYSMFLGLMSLCHWTSLCFWQCAVLKAGRGLRAFLLCRNSLLSCVRFWLYQKV